MLGQPARLALHAEFRTRASTQGRSAQGTHRETEAARPKRDQEFRDQRFLGMEEHWLWLFSGHYGKDTGALTNSVAVTVRTQARN